MKKTPLRPSTKRIERRTPMAKRNVARRKREHERAYGGEHTVWIRSHACMVDNERCEGRVEAAHTETGGVGRKADARTLVPLCSHHHRALHQRGVQTFEAEEWVSLKPRARWLWQRSPANPGNQEPAA